MQPESSSPETIQPTPVRTYRQAGIVQGIRWLSLALIVSLPWLAPFVLAQFVDDDFPEFIRRAVGLVATMASVTGVLLWFLLAGPFAWKTRFAITIVTVLAGFALARLTIRNVEFYGNLRYKIHYVWDKTREQAIAEDRSKQSTSPQTGNNLELDYQPETSFPTYRGVNFAGLVPAQPLNLEWTNQPPKVLWKQPIGGGYSQFVIKGKLAVTNEQRGDQEWVVAYHIDDGRQVWTYGYPAHFKETMGGDGPRATPTIDGEQVFSLGATGKLVCLNLRDGTLVWERDILEKAGGNIQWAMTASPLVDGDKLYVMPGVNSPAGIKDTAFWCLERASGKTLWMTGNGKAGYSSPMFATLHGVRTIVCFDGTGISIYDPAEKKELARFAWKTNEDINVAQPLLLSDHRIFISSGYRKGSAMLKVNRDDKGIWSFQQLWTSNKFHCRFTSPVLKDNFIYGLDEGRGMLTCLDAATGTRKWRSETNGKAIGYQDGQILLIGDKILVSSEDGYLALVLADPDQFTELGRVKVFKDRTWNCPAIAHGRAFIRNHVEMACVDLRDIAPSKSKPQ